MNAPTLILMDVDRHAGLPFPRSLPEFQRLFPGDAACAEYLDKLRAGMVRPHQDRIGGRANEHVEVDETWIGGRTRGEGRGVHHKVLVACAVEVRHRKPGTARDKRNDGRYAGRVRLAVAADRSAKSLCGFVDGAVAPGTLIVTDDWSGYADLRKRGYDHHAIAECGDSEVTEEFLLIIHLVFANLKTWLTGIHHGVSERHLQAYLNEFTFRFNRRFTLHLVGVCVNRIGVVHSTRRRPCFRSRVVQGISGTMICSTIAFRRLLAKTSEPPPPRNASTPSPTRGNGHT